MPAMTKRDCEASLTGSLAVKQIKFLFLKENNELRQRRKYQISCWSTLFQKVIFVTFKQFQYLLTLFTTFEFSVLHFNPFFLGNSFTEKVKLMINF